MRADAAGEVAAARFVASLHQVELLPHQVAGAGVLAERRGAGLAHPSAVVLLPRQVGKTTMLLFVVLARILIEPHWAARFTAQSGTVASHILTNPDNGWVTMVDAGPLSGRLRTVRAQGSEGIVDPRRRSYVKAFPPVPGKLRSNALDMVIMDECQEHEREIAEGLEADFGPAFSTRPRRQLVMCGTAGGPGWWAEKVAEARAGEHGLVEAGTWPDDEDPDDPATWARHHPGVLSGLTTIDHLHSERKRLGSTRFAREYGNRFDDGEAALDRVIEDLVWHGSTAGGLPPEPAAVGIDVAPDERSAAIVAVGWDAEQRLVAGIVAHRRHTAWVVPELARIRARHPGLPVVADGVSAAAPTIDLTRRAHIPVVEIPRGEFATACGALVQGMAAGRLLRAPHPSFDAARLAARRRVLDHGGWVWSRGRSAGDVTPIVAWTVAAWHARKVRDTRPRTRRVARMD